METTSSVTYTIPKFFHDRTFTDTHRWITEAIVKGICNHLASGDRTPLRHLVLDDVVPYNPLYRARWTNPMDPEIGPLSRHSVIKDGQLVTEPLGRYHARLNAFKLAVESWRPHPIVHLSHGSISYETFRVSYSFDRNQNYLRTVAYFNEPVAKAHVHSIHKFYPRNLVDLHGASTVSVPRVTQSSLVPVVPLPDTHTTC